MPNDRDLLLASTITHDTETARAAARREKARRAPAKWLLAPAVIFLLVWMIVPLAMTGYYSFRNYNLMMPSITGWAGWTCWTCGVAFRRRSRPAPPAPFSPNKRNWK